MAVYTQLSKSDCQQFLQHYTLGELTHLTGITSGVTNTNYRVTTTSGKYVVTVFEHIDVTNLPFYLDLVAHLAKQGVPCAPTITDHNGNTVQIVHSKPAVIQPWLAGESSLVPSVAQCHQVGELIWQLHRSANTFGQRRMNSHNQVWREKMAAHCKHYLNEDQHQDLQQAMRICTQLPWDKLPHGIIHADLFPDNVLFNHDHISGVFDFYYACYDALLLDVATTVNAWALDEKTGKLNIEKAQALLTRYQQKYAFTKDEKHYWSDILVAATLRFWLSRLYDKHNAVDPTGINHNKDPQPYYQLLKTYLQQPNILKIG